jgi:hypothetical protein
VPKNNRFAPLPTPTVGKLLIIRGAFATVTVPQEIASITVDSFTFVSPEIPNSPQASSPGTVGRSKRQLIAARLETPSKKAKTDTGKGVATSSEAGGST